MREEPSALLWIESALGSLRKENPFFSRVLLRSDVGAFVHRLVYAHATRPKQAGDYAITFQQRSAGVLE